MDTASSTASYLASSSIAPVGQTGLMMDMRRMAWTTELQYISGSIASRAMEERMGPPDARIPGFSKRWSFAGCTVIQRGRIVLVAERF